MTSEIQKLPTSSFAYWRVPSSQWVSELSKLQNQGFRRISFFIPWGMHESVKGAHDFSMLPKLRIEKLLKFIGELGMQAEIITGFLPHQAILPAWLYSELKAKSVFFKSHWFGSDEEELSLIELPSLFDPILEKGFIDFLRELLSVCELYKQPGGPLSSIVFDPGLLNSDLGAHQQVDFYRYLELRYNKIQNFNLVFRTNYRDFETTFSSQGMNTLYKQRPWLAAFDYKWCRSKMIQSFIEKILECAFSFHIVDIFQVLEEKLGLPKSTSDWGILVDGVTLETDSKTCVTPHAPFGFLCESIVQSYRLWDLILELADTESIPVGIFSLAKEQTLFQAKVYSIVTGKYLTQAIFEVLKKQLEQGGSFFFPFGLPLYNEAISPLEWVQSKTRKHISEKGLIQIEYSGGHIFYPDSEWGFSQDFWGKNKTVCNQILNRNV